jgi:hypothetical protein
MPPVLNFAISLDASSDLGKSVLRWSENVSESAHHRGLIRLVLILFSHASVLRVNTARKAGAGMKEATPLSMTMLNATRPMAMAMEK